ncbi:MAG: GlxA family transcriptional regulator [Proteobacteria bacterium]|nr:GlxA family transcriptional regulator [Pseudomonadota bacterium]
MEITESTSSSRIAPAKRGYLEVGIFLAPQYSLYGLILLIEVFRVANQNAGRRLFNWSFVSEDGSAVECGAGMIINADASIFSDFPFDLVFVVSGNDPVSYLSRRFVSWIHNLYSHGVPLAGIDTGAFALAEAGLLKGRRATCHWEAIPLFTERYPDTEIVESRYIIDAPFVTCAGGIATLDMILEIIGRDHGPVLANHIANGFVHSARQGSDKAQRSDAELGGNKKTDPVNRAIGLMEANIETPLSIKELADQAGRARRNLERDFRRQTQSSIGQYYVRVRLERAREMLFYGRNQISEISIMCGFSSPAVFTRTFQAHLGQSPRDYRSGSSAQEMARFRPHVTWSLSGSQSPSR